MNRRGIGGRMAVAAVGVLLCVSATSAQLAGRVGDVIEPVGSNGSVDWTAGLVTATGLGAPPPGAVNPSQARAMAKRAAYIVAQRNLLEVVKGVRVDSVTLVENFMVTSDVIKTEVSGFVKGAQIMQEKTNPDGSVEVLVGVRLGGDFANTLLPKETGGGVPLPVVPEPTASTAAFTGLIVDARGTGVRPAMAPKIRNEQGREVYGSAFVGRQYAVEQGMVGYLKDLGAAQGNPRVTDRPLLVKAVKADGPNKTDLIIRDSDAQTLHGKKENLSFLEKARVMVVVD